MNETPRVPRRSVLKAGAGLAALGTVPLVPAFAQTVLDTVLFAEACSTLIGLPSQQLYDPNRPGPLCPSFLLLCEQGIDEGTDQVQSFLDRYQDDVKSGLGPDHTAADLHEHHPVLSRLTAKLWLSGMWYGGDEDPSQLTRHEWYGNVVTNTFVHSGLAMRRAWIWRFAQAHPQGYSHFEVDSWGALPPSLQDYGVPA